MTDTFPSIVIENGSYRTRAGFSNDEIPQLNFISAIGRSTTSDKYFVGDDIFLKNHKSKFENLEVYSMNQQGLVYNWEFLEKNWSYIFEKLKIFDKNNVELPLVITEPVGTTKKHRMKSVEIAFEKFGVPAFSMLKTPLCVTYGVGKSNGLVIDLGASGVSVCGVIDGNVLSKSLVYSKYGGDFLNYQVFKFLGGESKLSRGSTLLKGFSDDERSKLTESFKVFDLNNNLLDDFKFSVLSSAQAPIDQENMMHFNPEAKDYKLPDGNVIQIQKEQLFITESLFKPSLFKSIDDSQQQEAQQQISQQGIIDMIISSLNKFRDTPEIVGSLLSNIIITGGTASIPDIDKRIYVDLNKLLPNFQISSFCNPSLVERQNSAWIGATILSSLNNFDGFVTKQEYEEYGEDAIQEKFK